MIDPKTYRYTPNPGAPTRIVEALKYDERIWRAFEMLKGIHQEALVDRLAGAVTPARTQQSIRNWRDDTFGPARSIAGIAARANKEMAELLTKLVTNDRHPGAGEEVADILIVLYGLASYLGVDLHAEVDKKMAINRAREWKLDGNGHGQHVAKEQS